MRIENIAVFFSILLLIPGCSSTPTTPSPPATNKPVINSFSASPETIDLGSASTLSWSVSNAQNVVIDQGIGTVDSTGSIAVSPNATVTYTLTASNANGAVSKSCLVTVNQPPVINGFAATPNVITLESSSTLSWDVSNAVTRTIDPGIGQVSATGSTIVSPNSTTVYTLTAVNGSFTVTATCMITVDWQNFICYKTATRTKYHRGNCQYLSQSKIQTTLGEACAQGLTPCSVCNPPSCR